VLRELARVKRTKKNDICTNMYDNFWRTFSLILICRGGKMDGLDGYGFES